MITKVTNTVSALKNLWIEIFLDKTSKVTNIADGSVLNAVAYGAAKIAQKAIKDIAITEAKIFPETATGEFLDKSAALFGVPPRKGVLGSATYVRVYAEPETVYDNTMFFINQNGIRFSVDTTVIVGKTGYSYVPVRSVNSGRATNVGANSIINVTPAPQGHIECTNEYMAIGGRDSEDDETFRIRIMTNLNNLSKGTLEYFTQVFQGIDDRILRVMNTGLGESGIYYLYIVTQNGIYLSEEELQTLLEQSKEYFSLFELNLSGETVGIQLKNADWFFIGSERGVDFRLELNSEYTIADVRRNIQVNITKYLDFRFWEAGKIVQWDDLLEIVKNTEGVKYVPDEFFFPHYDQQVPLNQLPRVRGFVMRDLTGLVLYDAGSELSPLFYPAGEEDLFKGLSDASLALSQPVYFTVTDEIGVPLEGVKITIGHSTITTNGEGLAIISLPNGTYSYTAFKALYLQTQNTFVVLNSPVNITIGLTIAPYMVYFTVIDENDLAIQNAVIEIAGKNISTNINGEAQIQINSGKYPYKISKIGYDTIENVEVEVTMSDVYVPATMYFSEWKQTFTVTDEETEELLSGVLINIGKNTYVTNTEGVVSIDLINGVYTLNLSKQGMDSKQEKIIVENREESRQFQLKKSIYITTFIVKSLTTGNILVGALISIENGMYVLRTSSEGMTSISLPIGNYDINVSQPGYDTSTGQFGVQEEPELIEILLDDKHYEVNLTVLDYTNNPVFGAAVSIGGEVLDTNEAGEIKASLQNGSYPFTITKLGYINYEGTVVVQEADVNETVLFELRPWESTFVVKDGVNPVEGATVNVNGVILTTDTLGQVKTMLTNGTYNYTVTKLGYRDFVGTVIVFNKELQTVIPMLLRPWNVLFVVIGNRMPAIGVKITSEGVSVTTNAAGIATMGLVNGTHQFVIEGENYVTYSGEITVNNENQIAEITIIPLTSLVSFTITDTNEPPNPIQGISISIDNSILVTDNLGQASKEVPRGTWTVSYFKDGYVTKNEEIVVEKIPIEITSKVDEIYFLDFLVKGKDDVALIGAEVTITGEAILPGIPATPIKKLVTDENGRTPQIEVINGSYSYGILFPSYSPMEATSTIIGLSKTDEIILTEGFETKFFFKNPDGEALEGVNVLVDGVDLKTSDIEGKVIYFLSNGEHTWVATKEGFEGQSGKIVVADETQTILTILITGGLLTLRTFYNFWGTETAAIGNLIIISNDTITKSATTNGQGIALMQLGLGTYDIRIRNANQADYVKKDAIVIGKEPQTVSIDVTNWRKVVSTISVTSDGVALEDVKVSITGVQDNEEPFNPVQANTGSTGRVQFSLLRGTYDLALTKDGYKPETLTGTKLPIQNDVPININFFKYRTLTFTIENNKGELVEGIEVTCDNKKVLSDINGKAVFTNVIDGVYDYSTAAKDSYQPVTGSITINGASVDQKITLTNDFILTLTVKDQFDEFLEGESVAYKITMQEDENFVLTGLITSSVTEISLPVSSDKYLVTSGQTEVQTRYSTYGLIGFEFSNLTGEPVSKEDSVLRTSRLKITTTKNGNTEILGGVTIEGKIDISLGTIPPERGELPFLVITDNIKGEVMLEVVPGSQNLKLSKTGFETIPLSFVNVSLIDPISEKNYAMVGLYTVTVTVKRNGLPSVNTRVDVWLKEASIQKAYTGATGVTTFYGIKWLSTLEENYTIQIEGDLYHQKYISNGFNPTANYPISVALTPLYSLVFYTGQSGATITMTGGKTQTLTTDTQGVATFTNIPTGSVSYTITKAFYETITGIETFNNTPAGETVRTIDKPLTLASKLAQIKTSNGAYQLDQNYKYYSFVIFGGGGGGGGSTGNSGGGAGGGGSSGVYKMIKNLSMLDAIKIEIGTGGSGATSATNDGGSGRSSSVDTTTVAGGGGGYSSGGSSATRGGNGGNGGSGGTGIATIPIWGSWNNFGGSGGNGGGNGNGNGGGGGGYGSGGGSGTAATGGGSGGGSGTGSTGSKAGGTGSTNGGLGGIGGAGTGGNGGGGGGGAVGGYGSGGGGGGGGYGSGGIGGAAGVNGSPGGYAAGGGGGCGGYINGKQGGGGGQGICLIYFHNEPI